MVSSMIAAARSGFDKIDLTRQKVVLPIAFAH